MKITVNDVTEEHYRIIGDFLVKQRGWDEIAIITDDGVSVEYRSGANSSIMYIGHAFTSTHFDMRKAFAGRMGFGTPTICENDDLVALLEYIDDDMARDFRRRVGDAPKGGTTECSCPMLIGGEIVHHNSCAEGFTPIAALNAYQKVTRF